MDFVIVVPSDGCIRILVGHLLQAKSLSLAGHGSWFALLCRSVLRFALSSLFSPMSDCWETGLMSSMCDNNTCMLRRFSGRFRIWHREVSFLGGPSLHHYAGRCSSLRCSSSCEPSFDRRGTNLISSVCNDDVGILEQFT